jgi:hypothetical protein
MRESQMKKLVALAVAGAFVAPVYAADITISGSSEASYTDSSGTSITALDTSFKISASTELANGIKVSTAQSINSETGANDGGNNVTLSGSFGKLEMGDVSSAADKFDDRGDFGKVLSLGVSAEDSSIGYTLPTLVPNLTVYFALQTDTGVASTVEPAGSGVALSYKAGPASFAYGMNDRDIGSKLTYTGGSVSFSGVTVSYEIMDEKAATGANLTKEKAIGVKYTMGDVTVWYASEDQDEANASVADWTNFGLHYNLGSGVLAFLEMRDNGLVANSSASAVGVEFKF